MQNLSVTKRCPAGRERGKVMPTLSHLKKMYLTAAWFWAAFLLGTGLVFLASPAAAEDEPPLLVIFHTNDVHGYALEEKDGDGRPARLGYARLKAYVDRYPARHKLLLDAGDVLHGQPFATARRGEFIARMLAPLGYDALAVGNHDFDYGRARLMELRDTYHLNFIAANIIEREDGAPLLPPYLVKDFGDLKVGIFGLTTPETPLKTSPGNVESVTFGPADELVYVARDMTRHLREKEKVDLVVAVTHLGTDPLDRPGSPDIAARTPGLDLVVDGHSHSLVAGLKAGDALIVSAGSYLENIGRVTVTRSPQGQYILAPKLIAAADLAGTPPDPALSELAGQLTAELDQELSQVVAHSHIELDGRRETVRTSGTNLGRVICAAMQKATLADAAILNGGSVRASIPAGEITRGRILAVLPYGNYVLTVRLTGADLLEALRIGLDQPEEGGFPQFYGLRVTARERKAYGPDGALTRLNQIESVEVGGRPLDPAAEYTVAINDFMYAGGDGYTVFAKSPAREFATLEEALRRFLTESDPAAIQAVADDDVLAVIVEE